MLALDLINWVSHVLPGCHNFMISKSDHGPSSLESHFQQEVFPTQVDLLDIGRPMQEEKVAIIATGESSITNSYEPSMFDDF